MFEAVLVANRGEIAVRVIRTLRRLGVRAIAVYSDADAEAPHTRLADVAIRLGPAAASESYLSSERLLAAGQETGADAIHPGYGFLSENAAFARAVTEAGFAWVGPPPEAIRAMGDKIQAKRTVEAAGVEVVPGVHEAGLSDDALAAAAGQVGFPVLVKAAAGGGGKGMRVVREPAGLAAAVAAARREARGAFGDDALLLERYLERPRHIEVQVLADAHGTVLHLGERECSLQRRHQKIVEEAPSPAVDEHLRERMGAAAVATARACGYTNAGTVEFIATAEEPGRFYFLEMNTRLQVEHPVTEEVYGLDLVEWQLRVAAGQRLTFGQGDVVADGHAIEARVYAEDPRRGFLPTGGSVLAWRPPEGVGIRVDAGVAVGGSVGTDYDPLIAKVIAAGPDRVAALDRLDAALGELVILGVTTNVDYLRALLATADVRAGRLDTTLAERVADELAPASPPSEVLAAAALARLLQLEPDDVGAADPFDLTGGWRVGEPAWTTWRLRLPGADPVDVQVRGRAASAEVAVGGEAPQAAAIRRSDDGDLSVTLDGTAMRFAYAEAGDVAWLGAHGAAWALREEEQLQAARHADEAELAGPLVAPLPGTVVLVNVAEGDTVGAGETLIVVEAMKMEHAITAPAAGVVVKLAVRKGDRVEIDQPLVTVEPTGDGG